ncbi:MAG: SURF1 family protein [Pseudomonadota bacterium]
MLKAGPSAVVHAAGGRRRVVVLVAAVLASAVTARLGWWQLDRAQQKLDLQARISARGSLPALPQAELPRSEADAVQQHYRPVQLRGRWLADQTIYLDNRQMNARQGFFVVTPLLLAPGDAVLVQRGWMPRDFADRSRLQPLPAQPGEVMVTGRLAPPPSSLLALAGAEQGPIRQNLDLPSVASTLGLALRPMSVQQTAPTQAATGTAPASATTVDDGLLRQWPAVAVDVGKHHGYAFQWFALSALLVGLTLWFQVIRPRWRPAPRGPAPSKPVA